MSGYNKDSGVGMGIIVVFQKFFCDHRKTRKYNDRKDEHGCNGKEQNTEIKVTI